MIASGDTVQEEKHVEIAENKDTPPRKATKASIDRHSTSSQQGRKRVDPLKIKKRVSIGRPWE